MMNPPETERETIPEGPPPGDHQRKKDPANPQPRVLEPYPKGTYVTYPYLGSHCDRGLVLLAVIRYTRYLITTRYRMEFLHTILHVA